MLPLLPMLENYEISEKYGFLPPESLDRLPDPSFSGWERVVDNLQSLILTKRLRGVIDELPVVSTTGLHHESEWRRAHSILAFMAHGYIWSEDVPSERLPSSIAIPLIEVSAHLGVPPVATYAAVCLWNYKIRTSDGDLHDLSNLAALTTFTGSADESWFYIVSVAIEARGATTIPLMLKAIQAAREDDTETVTRCLQEFSEILVNLARLLERMHDGCDPHVFYYRIRPFLAGSKNMADAGLPNGVIYEDGTGSNISRHYSGGSNAQSSMIQFFDIILGIKHHPTGLRRADLPHSPLNTKCSPSHQSFMLEMRKYMPAPHRRFLEDIESVANIYTYVCAHCDCVELTSAYDSCLKMLYDFRSTHIKIVSRYIIIKSRESKSIQPEEFESPHPKLDIASSPSQGCSEISLLKGTGGTVLIPFLKQVRDETADSAFNAWTRHTSSKKSYEQEEPCFTREK